MHAVDPSRRIGLAIGFALPTFAQQKNTSDPQLRQAVDVLTRKTDAAYNNGDAAAMAALYTEDAVLVTDAGPIYGREAIEKHYANLFQKIHFINHISQADQSSNSYPPGAKVSKKQIAEINIRPDSFHGEWNYTIRPNNGST